MPQDMSNRILDKIPEFIPNKMPWDIPNRKKISNKILKHMLYKMPEGMPEHQKICQIEYQKIY